MVEPRRDADRAAPRDPGAVPHTAPDSPGRECPRQEEASAWAQGALSGEPARDVERHLEHCASCRRWAEDVRGMLGDLARLPAPAWKRPARRWPLRAAAALVLVALAARVLWLESGPAAPAPLDPVTWLAEELQPSGTWLAAPPLPEAPPRGRSGVGLHGLGLLALIEGSAPGRHEAAIARATDWLLQVQGDDGWLDVGDPFAGFGHVVGTAALLEAADRTGRADVREAADRALARLLDGTGASFPQPGPATNTALTAWTLRALMRADELGWDDLGGAIAAGRARLAAECGIGVRPAHLGERQVAALALTPQRAPVAAALGPLYVAAEDTLSRREP